MLENYLKRSKFSIKFMLRTYAVSALGCSFQNKWWHTIYENQNNALQIPDPVSEMIGRHVDQLSGFPIIPTDSILRFDICFKHV
jgi:hypothetical protein